MAKKLNVLDVPFSAWEVPMHYALWGWVPVQRKTKGFVEFVGLRELSEKETFPHWALAMALALNSIWSQTDMGFNSDSAIYWQCYLLSLTLSGHLYVHILAKTLWHFPVSPQIVSRNFIMAYRTLITRLLSTFLISCSPGSNSSGKPLTSASGPLHMLFPTLGSYPPRLCKPASLISFRSLFKCYKRKGHSQRESMPKLLLLSPPHEGPHGAQWSPSNKVQRQECDTSVKGSRWGTLCPQPLLGAGHCAKHILKLQALKGESKCPTYTILFHKLDAVSRSSQGTFSLHVRNYLPAKFPAASPGPAPQTALCKDNHFGPAMRTLVQLLSEKC